MARERPAVKTVIACIPLVFACSSGGNSSQAAGQLPGTGGMPAGVGSGGQPIATSSGGAPINALGTGGATTVTSGGAVGTGTHDPSLFTWPEGTVVDGGGGTRCKPGHYVGTYSCQYQFGDAGLFSYPLSGPVDLRLEQGQSGEFLTVSGGKLTSAVGVVSLDAELVGTLNCETGEFSGTLQNGTFAISPFPPGGTFDGHLNASFVSDGPKLDGTWTLRGGGQFSASSCTGPWNATWQGP